MSTLRFTQTGPIGIASAEEVAELRQWLRIMVTF